jgi:V/A-type H+-transporting ATPase subunit D
MAKIKLTKSELKAQRQELERYQRFLPTLQLKKQQLQSETKKARDRLAEVAEKERALFTELEDWIGLFAEGAGLEDLLQVRSLTIPERNVVGLRIPSLEAVEFEEARIDLLTTPPWLDEGVDRLRQAVRLRLDKQVLEHELELLQAELRRTTQRVNLFEKVKIPQCRENIRIIQIALGDLQTMAVARAKLAKAKLQERTSSV